MRTPRLLLLCSAISIPLFPQDIYLRGDSSLRGFLQKDVPAEQRLEQQAQGLPEAAHLRRYMNFMAAEPHHAGSPRSKAVADYILSSFKEWGLDAQIEEFEALLPYPTIRQLEMISPRHFVAKLKEPAVTLDPDSANAHQLPTYNAYAASGEVTAEVVYANYGLPEDYEWLAKKGIDVKGKIVITRYGASWRGIKPKVAAERGAIACLIYSDPQQDGYYEGDVYPNGPMRPAEGVQRGSVMDMPLYPGDPLSPGWASEKGARKLAIADAKTLMKIPVLPLSYGDAGPILRQLTGPSVPREWRGALPFTYHAGPGVTVHMKTDYDWSNRPIYDVIATIPGAESPDEWILAGNHHDAWVNGADDPLSGSVALMETARTLALLRKQGWKPKRTVKIALWDGEEFGLIGSTEWVEKHQDELRTKAVAYLNSDSTGKGWLGVGGSHTLEQFANDVGLSIMQPGTNTNLVDALLHHPGSDEDTEVTVNSRGKKVFGIGALGAGSDYVAFLDFLGIASMNEGFGGRTIGGVYHSIYDSNYWYTHFSDGTFSDGKALSQFTTAALLRMANASVLPFEFGRFAGTVDFYLEEIQKQAQREGQRLDFAAVHRQVDILKVSHTKYEALLDAAMQKNSLDAGKLASVNQDLIRTERTLTRPEGLPNRGWYKHQIYAPGFYTGYGVKTIPGVREAVDAKDWPLAQKESAILEECLDQMNQAVDHAITAMAGM